MIISNLPEAPCNSFTLPNGRTFNIELDRFPSTIGRLVYPQVEAFAGWLKSAGVLIWVTPVQTLTGPISITVLYQWVRLFSHHNIPT